MRKLAAAVLILSGVLLCGCSQQNEQTVVTPPFWSAENAETGGKLYLLGSMHVGRSDTCYPDYIMEAFYESGIIAAELDTTDIDSADIRALNHLRCGEGVSARDCFGEDYDEVREFFESKNLLLTNMDDYIPYMWCSSLTTEAAEQAGLSADYGTESYFLSLAHEQNKTIVEIESYDEQYRMMSELPMSVQVLAVTSAVGEENFAKQIDSAHSLYEAWAGFDETALEALNFTVYDGVPQELSEDYAVYMDKMYFERQQLMADSAVALAGQGETVFMLVGAAHFYIEEDILTLLCDEGYSVTKLLPETASEAA